MRSKRYHSRVCLVVALSCVGLAVVGLAEGPRATTSLITSDWLSSVRATNRVSGPVERIGDGSGIS